MPCRRVREGQQHGQPDLLVGPPRGRSPATPASRAPGSRPGWPSWAPRSPASACRRRPSRRCSRPATCRGRIDSRDRRRRARASCWRATCARRSPEVIFHLAAQPLVLESLRGPGGDLPEQHPGRRQPARRRPAPAVGSAPSSWSPATSATCAPTGAAPRATRWAGTTPTAPARPAPRSSPRPIAACFFPPDGGVGLATARAGNVIGGGDFSPGRLLPDLIRAFAAGRARRAAPSATASGPGSTCSTRWPATCCWPSGWRPTRPRSRPPGISARPGRRAGPRPRSPRRPRDRFGGGSWRAAASDLAIEVPMLLLSSDQAHRWLGWRPRLATEEAVAWAVDGYRALLRAGRHALAGRPDPCLRRPRAGAAPARLPLRGRARAAPCLRLSPPTSRSSCCAAGWAPGWARARPCAPSPCSTSARSRCCSTSWAATAASAFAASCSAPATAAR